MAVLLIGVILFGAGMYFSIQPLHIVGLFAMLAGGAIIAIFVCLVVLLQIRKNKWKADQDRLASQWSKTRTPFH